MRPVGTVARQVADLGGEAIRVVFIAGAAQQPLHRELIRGTRVQARDVLVDARIAIVVERVDVLGVDLDQLAVLAVGHHGRPLVVVEAVVGAATVGEEAPTVADMTDRDRIEAHLEVAIVDQVPGPCRHRCHIGG